MNSHAGSFQDLIVTLKGIERRIGAQNLGGGYETGKQHSIFKRSASYIVFLF